MPTTAHAQRPAAPATPRPRERHVGPAWSTAQEHAHLVRVLASDPVYLDWLHQHNARLLTAEADRLRASGSPSEAALLYRRADAHAAGEVSPWS